jgi:integrase/recombinase XerD
MAQRPAQAEQGVRVPRKRKLPKIITRDEARALLDAPNLRAPTGLRNRCILELMYRAGLRVGEVVKLQPRDVDVQGGTVRIHDGKGGDGTAYFDSASVAPLLDTWKRERRHHASTDSPLFCTLQGGAVSVRYVEQMVQRMRRRAGIKANVTPHVLRHTFATELLDEGLHIREVQEAVRHADLSTTMIYTHVLDSNLRAKIQRRKR